MKKAIPFSANARAEGENPKHLRKAGSVPAIVYGNAHKSASIKCSAKEFHNVYLKAGENTIVELDVDGKKVPCLIHSVTLDPITSAYEHIDFYAVDMTKKVTTRVPVIFEGESPAAKNLGGVLLTIHSDLEVSCLPNDIPSHFTVSLNSLENFHDSITVASLKVPANVTITTPAQTAIIIVQEPRKEEVVEVAATAVAADGTAAPAADGAAAPAAAGAAPAAAGKDAKAAAPAAGAKAPAPAKK